MCGKNLLIAILATATVAFAHVPAVSKCTDEAVPITNKAQCTCPQSNENLSYCSKKSTVLSYECSGKKRISCSYPVCPAGKEMTPYTQIKGLYYYSDFPLVKKPAIYLYTTKKLNVNIQLDPYVKITTDIPRYKKDTGWNVAAYPDGRIVDLQPK